jgi:branched-chain amino acid transport system substrate-binding protein
MKKTATKSAIALSVLALVGAACGSDEKAEDTKTTEAAKPADSAAAPADSAAAPAGGEPCAYKIAFQGALSGDNGALGTNMVNGAQIAVDAYNAKGGCQLSIENFDSKGSPDEAPPLATAIAGDESIIALIGPGFSGETKASMPTFEAAGLVMITPGATNAALSTNGWDSFHRVLANDDKQAPGIVTYIQGSGATKVGVIDDASEYGKGLADSVKSGLGDLLVAEDTIDPKAADFSAAITKMKEAGVETVFYGGYYAEAAKLVQQMADAGVTAKFVAGDGVLDKAYVEAAGKAAEGSILTATGAPADVNAEFAAAFNAKFGEDPGLYSPEAYDIANVFIAGIEAGKTDRAGMLEWVNGYNAPGITKTIKFDATGEPEGNAVFHYEVKDGIIVSLGIIK